jgi:uncharacterized protein YcbX
LPNTDPDTSVKDAKQPFNYIQKNRAIDEGAPTSGCLGMHLVPTKESIGGVIRVGDEIEVLKTGVHRFIADAEPEAQRPVL